MTERRKAVLLRAYVEGVLWLVEAEHITADEAARELMKEGIEPARAQSIVMQARITDAD